MDEYTYDKYLYECYGIDLTEYEWDDEDYCCPDFYLDPELELNFN